MTEPLFRENSQPDQPTDVAILLVPEFSMLSFTGVLEPLRLANSLSGRQLYRWQTLSREGLSVQASNGVEIAADAGLAEVERPENLIVCGGDDTHMFQDALTCGWLRRWAREGSHIGALCTGTHVLATAGILSGYRCTIHWADIVGLTEAHPSLEVEPLLYEVDRSRFTCAGGVAAIDMLLSEIARAHGEDLAAAVSEQLLHERIRRGDDQQRLPLRARFSSSPRKLTQVVAYMENHLETPVSLGAIGGAIGLSRRQMERLFRTHLGTTPARYYLRLRLIRARDLLTQTHLPVTEVAYASGFSTASHFSKCYREMFGRKPISERQSGSSRDTGPAVRAWPVPAGLDRPVLGDGPPPLSLAVG